MIPVTFHRLAFIYLVLMVGPILAAWAISEWRRHRRERAAFRDCLRCALCAFEFRDLTSETLPRCPRCGSLNERTRVADW